VGRLGKGREGSQEKKGGEGGKGREGKERREGCPFIEILNTPLDLTCIIATDIHYFPLNSNFRH